jgi:LPXTG-motif cell wall-anchored protein
LPRQIQNGTGKKEGEKLKKLVLLVAMLAIVVVAAAPAIAQVGQGFSERNTKSGTSSPKFEVSNKGNNASLCVTGVQSTQSGNVLNEQGVVQYNSEAGDLDFTGSNITLTPSKDGTCTTTIKQTAAPKGEAKASGVEAKAAAASPAPKGVPQLPATGGITGSASLLGLGAGALLVAGGLLARRIIR